MATPGTATEPERHRSSASPSVSPSAFAGSSVAPSASASTPAAFASASTPAATASRLLRPDGRAELEEVRHRRLRRGGRAERFDLDRPSR
ncbi:hypothetical protein ACIO5Z_33955 [Streptomyces rochei]|uniref:hypothetical protein n=1 Tax=Streptomyces rochei TaxID=1928 RepID=UPI00381FF4D8